MSQIIQNARDHIRFSYSAVILESILNILNGVTSRMLLLSNYKTLQKEYIYMQSNVVINIVAGDLEDIFYSFQSFRTSGKPFKKKKERSPKPLVLCNP